MHLVTLACRTADSASSACTRFHVPPPTAAADMDTASPAAPSLPTARFRPIGRVGFSIAACCERASVANSPARRLRSGSLACSLNETAPTLLDLAKSSARSTRLASSCLHFCRGCTTLPSTNTPPTRTCSPQPPHAIPAYILIAPFDVDEDPLARRPDSASLVGSMGSARSDAPNSAPIPLAVPACSGVRHFASASTLSSSNTRDRESTASTDSSGSSSHDGHGPDAHADVPPQSTTDATDASVSVDGAGDMYDT